MQHVILKSLGVVLVSMMIIVALVWTAISLLSPKIYYSNATIQIIFPESSIAKYDAELLNAMTRTISMLVYSDTVLADTAKALDLSAEWGKRYHAPSGYLRRTTVLRILKHSLSISPVEDAVGLVRVGFMSGESLDTVRISNALSKHLARYVSHHPQQIKGVDVRLIMRAEMPQNPLSPPLGIVIIKSVGLAAGMAVIGVVLVFLAKRLRGGKVRTRVHEDVKGFGGKLEY